MPQLPLTTSDAGFSSRHSIHAGLLLLAFSSGATDAFAFLSLGGIFTGMMTGNLILIGMFTRPEFVQTLAGAAVAIVFFAGGAFVGFRLSKQIAPGFIATRLLVPSTIVQAVGTALWICVPRPAGHIEQFVIIALLAVALSLQTVAAKKASDVTGITTTYVTGTLTTTMQEFAESRGRGNLLRVLTVLSLPLGAVCATALIAVAWWPAPVLPLLGSVAATIFLRRSATR